MRVVINAQVPSGAAGGVEQILLGLASGLAEVARPGEEYIFLSTRGEDSWLRPHVRGACRIVCGGINARGLVRRVLRTIPAGAQLHRALRDWQRRVSASLPPASDGTAERLRAGVMHFPYQGGFFTSIPSIYSPWDLQHVHHPEFFTTQQALSRDRWYRALCAQAAIVSVATDWAKKDLVEHLEVDARKIEVVPVAPAVYACTPPSGAAVATIRAQFDLWEQFAYYPAQTWPHKNHLAIIRALLLLRSRGAVRQVVFTGAETPYARELRAESIRLGVQSQVRFLGFVSPLAVQCLYTLATCVIFPSRFEGWGLPVSEAFRAGVPVASSNASCLPEVTSGAALMFDPDDIEAIAGALERLFTDEALRRELIHRGREVVQPLSWSWTAGRFRELYLRIARA